MALLRQLQLLLQLPRTPTPPIGPAAEALPPVRAAPDGVGAPDADASRRSRRRPHRADPAGSETRSPRRGTPHVDEILHAWSEGILGRTEVMAEPDTLTYRGVRGESDARGHAAPLPLEC